MKYSGKDCHAEDEHVGYSENCKTNKRPYHKIEDNKRLSLLKKVLHSIISQTKEDKLSLKVAAAQLGIKYSSAKTIMNTYRTKGRIIKKLTRDRGVKKERLFSLKTIINLRNSEQPLKGPSNSAGINKQENMGFNKIDDAPSKYDMNYRSNSLLTKSFLVGNPAEFRFDIYLHELFKCICRGQIHAWKNF